jgi:hypothetical protein
VFLLNSRRTRFTAAPSRLHATGALLLPKLRSQFAEFLNKLSLERLWIFSSSTCVGLWYGSQLLSLEVFLGSVKSAAFGHTAYCFAPHCYARPDLPKRTSLRASNLIAIGGPAYPSASPHRQTRFWEVRNINRMSIGYASRPRLRDRLTLSGLTFLRKP